MKAPENCENIIRNRKQKSAQVESSEKTVKVQTKITEQITENKEDLKKSKELKKAAENPKSDERLIQEESEAATNDNSISNFTIKIEFDPMSIALFTLAIVTRFFRLSEPRNIV